MDKLEMTDSEIIAYYKQAKNKRKMVKILVELNWCLEEDILRVLSKAVNVDEVRDKRRDAKFDQELCRANREWFYNRNVPESVDAVIETDMIHKADYINFVNSELRCVCYTFPDERTSHSVVAFARKLRSSILQGVKVVKKDNKVYLIKEFEDAGREDNK